MLIWDYVFFLSINILKALRLESYENPLVLRITNVLKNSPADKCGLQKQNDFVLGLLSHTFSSLNEFSDIVNGIAYRKGQKLDVPI
jgi:C-terminal processing protease CtpA/Prc